ncbi:MAG: recombination mediator protein UvsY [Betaproteobacteria bacterium]
MTLEDVLVMWEADSVIDEINLDETSIKSAKLHAKYLQLLSIAKLRLKKKEMEFDAMKKDKWLYFEGKMTKDQIDERGWKYDPFDGGTKPMKSNMDYYYKSDSDLTRLQSQIDYQKTLIDTLIDIMDNIKWRHQTIKNVIEWRKFTAGA